MGPAPISVGLAGCLLFAQPAPARAQEQDQKPPARTTEEAGERCREPGACGPQERRLLKSLAKLRQPGEFQVEEARYEDGEQPTLQVTAREGGRRVTVRYSARSRDGQPARLELGRMSEDGSFEPRFSLDPSGLPMDASRWPWASWSKRMDEGASSVARRLDLSRLSPPADFKDALASLPFVSPTALAVSAQRPPSGKAPALPPVTKKEQDELARQALDAVKTGRSLPRASLDLLRRITEQGGALELPGKEFQLPGLARQEGKVLLRFLGDPERPLVTLLHKHGDATQDHMGQQLRASLEPLSRELDRRGSSLLVVSPLGRSGGHDGDDAQASSAANGRRLLAMASSLSTAFGSPPRLILTGLSGGGRELNGVFRALEEEPGLARNVLKIVDADALPSWSQDTRDQDRERVARVLQANPHIAFRGYNSDSRDGSRFAYMQRYSSRLAEQLLGQGFGRGEGAGQAADRVAFFPAFDGTHYGALSRGIWEFFDGIP